MSVVLYFSFVCVSAYANVSFKPTLQECLRAGLCPGFSSTAAPPVCVLAVIGTLACGSQTKKIKIMDVYTWKLCRVRQCGHPWPLPTGVVGWHRRWSNPRAMSRAPDACADPYRRPVWPRRCMPRRALECATAGRPWPFSAGVGADSEWTTSDAGALRPGHAAVVLALVMTRRWDRRTHSAGRFLPLPCDSSQVDKAKHISHNALAATALHDKSSSIGNVAFRQHDRPLQQQDASYERHRICSHATLLPLPLVVWNLFMNCSLPTMSHRSHISQHLLLPNCQAKVLAATSQHDYQDLFTPLPRHTNTMLCMKIPFFGRAAAEQYFGLKFGRFSLGLGDSSCLGLVLLKFLFTFFF